MEQDVFNNKKSHKRYKTGLFGAQMAEFDIPVTILPLTQGCQGQIGPKWEK